MKILNKKSLNPLGFNPSSSSESNKIYMPYVEFEIDGIQGTFKDCTQMHKNDVEIHWNGFECIFYTNSSDCGGRNNISKNTFPAEFTEILEHIIDTLVEEQWNMSPEYLKSEVIK